MPDTTHAHTLSCAQRVLTTRVGPFNVADATSDEIAETLIKGFGSQQVAYALHVGGLNVRQNAHFVEALNQGSVLYADGIAVVLLARLAGAKRIMRTPTTDFGWTLINRLSKHCGRRIKLAIIGGPPGLAERAGKTLEANSPADIIHTVDGYQQDYHADFQVLQTESPDVILVGMGMPKEAMWVRENGRYLPNALIVTCGGWLGFLAGDERRAPPLLQQLGLEWFYRLLQAPWRLVGRYTSGMLSTFALIPTQLRVRRQRP